LEPIHKSGRGAGGHCFIKDFAAFKSIYDKSGDKLGSQLLKALEEKNIELLKESNKDLNILEQVYDRQ
jgi:UDP-glucose 6-dehydrogenase